VTDRKVEVSPIDWGDLDSDLLFFFLKSIIGFFLNEKGNAKITT
jgi:hypothetical protein